MHIAIAGNIGAGKTSLTVLLHKHYGWEAHYEDVVENDDDINPVNPEPLPSNEPENEPDTPSATTSEPDTTESAFEIKPFFIINSFAMLSFFHCPKRS